MNPGRYVALRLLEIECGFPSYYDEILEPYFISLDEEYSSSLRVETLIKDISGPTLVQVKNSYIELLCRVTKSPPQINIDTMYAVFMLSRDYIKHYQIQRNALYAIAICHWVGNFIDESDVERDAPCHSLFYEKKQVISLMNYGFDFVISSIYKLFRINRLYNIFCRIFFKEVNSTLKESCV